MHDSNAAIVRLVAIHAAVVGLPVLVVALALQLWVLALPLAVLAGGAVTAWRLRGIDERIGRALHARPVTAEEEPRLAGLAENIAMAVGEPVPHLHVIPSDTVNAIGWGVANGPSHLAVTTGLLQFTEVVELEAVVGHFLSSARGRTVEVTTLAAALFGPFAHGPLTGLVVSLVRGDEERSIVRADLDGVRATRYPPGMVGVLERIRALPTDVDGMPAAFAVLCFAAPDDGGGPFAIHPAIDDRIDLLREI